MKNTHTLFAAVAAFACFSVSACRNNGPQVPAATTSAAARPAADATTEDRARAAEVHNQSTLLEDLQAHHAQGVALAQLAAQSASHPELRSYASTLLRTEQQAVDAIGTQSQRLDGSSGPITGEGSAGNPVSDVSGDQSGKPENGADVGVSGLGTVEGTGRDLGALTQLSGDEFDRVFLDAMIEHLEAGIAMKEDASSGPVSGGTLEELIRQERSQVDQLNQWRTTWFQNGSNGD